MPSVNGALSRRVDFHSGSDYRLLWHIYIYIYIYIYTHDIGSPSNLLRAKKSRGIFSSYVNKKWLPLNLSLM